MTHTTTDTTAPLNRTFGVKRFGWSEERIDFGLRDLRGREIGALVRRWYKIVEERVDRVCWRSRADDYMLGASVRFVAVQAARNGRPFGASVSRQIVGVVGEPETEKKAEAHIATRLASMRKRYVAQIKKGKV